MVDMESFGIELVRTSTSEPRKKKFQENYVTKKFGPEGDIVVLIAKDDPLSDVATDNI